MPTRLRILKFLDNVNYSTPEYQTDSLINNRYLPYGQERIAKQYIQYRMCSTLQNIYQNNTDTTKQL